jgi:cell wall-associated NlpC family hydrolase
MRILFIAIIMLLLGGCTAKTPPPPSDFVGKCANPVEELHNSPLTTDKLLQQYTAWEGTRYRVGGLSRKGIDCSGFVYLTYQDLLGVDLPRSAYQQASLGKQVQTKELRTGDLVFFKTGRRGRHVGIYLDGGRFMHASTTKGVTISSLDDRYWSRKYWKATRLQFQRG